MKKILKRWGLVLLASVMVLSLAACGSSESTGGTNFLTIATASTGGTYYPIGVGMGNLWTEKLGDEGIRATGQASAGSVENIDLLRNGEAQLAILQGLIAAQAYSGQGNFEGNAYEGLRTIAMLWPNVEHFVLANNHVETGTISDIEGKRFSVGPQASGTEQSTLVIMEGIGLTKDDISPEYLGYDDTASALKDGRIDGGSMPAGVPVASVTDLYASGTDVTILEVTDEQLEAINNIYNAWYRYVIPADAYPNLDKEIHTIAQPNLLAVADTVDEDVVYLLTKTLFENLDYMYGVHDSAKFIKLETALDGLPAPLHPGAYKYYQEVGLDIPEHLVPPEK